MPRLYKKIDSIIRFRSKWELSIKHFYNGTPCWEWTAGKFKRGYGSFYEGQNAYAHRFAYEHYRQSIPEGLELDHLCRIRHCVNPFHLEVVTHAENIKRGDAGIVSGLQQQSKTHCPQKHAYNEENTYIGPNGKRVCRTCKRKADQQRYQERKQKAIQ